MKLNGESAVADGNAVLLEEAEGLAGHGGSGVDDLHSGAGEALDDGPKEGIVRAAQDDDIGPLVQQGLQGRAHSGFGLRAIQDAVFH